MFHLTQLFSKATNRLQNQLFTQLKTQDPLNLFKMMPGSPGTSHRADPGANPGPGSGTVPLPLGSPSSRGWEQASLHKLTAGKYVGAAHALLKSSFVLSYSPQSSRETWLKFTGNMYGLSSKPCITLPSAHYVPSNPFQTNLCLDVNQRPASCLLSVGCKFSMQSLQYTDFFSSWMG